MKSLETEEAPCTPRNKKPDPWSGFKRKSSSQIKEIPIKKRRLETSEECICLKCGTELARSRDYYRERHWKNAHPSEKVDLYKSMVVLKDHEKAKKLLQQNEQNGMKENASKNITTGEYVHNSSKQVQPQLQSEKIIEDNSSVLCETPISTTETVKPQNSQLLHSAGSTTQKSLDGFFNVEEKTQSSVLEKIESGVNQILVRLGCLTVNDTNRSQPVNLEVNCNVTTLKLASNLMEAKHPDIIVETLVDGCKITCAPCKKFLISHTTRKM